MIYNISETLSVTQAFKSNIQDNLILIFITFFNIKIELKLKILE